MELTWEQNMRRREVEALEHIDIVLGEIHTKLGSITTQLYYRDRR
jgi:hypothetical protein